MEVVLLAPDSAVGNLQGGVDLEFGGGVRGSALGDQDREATDLPLGQDLRVGGHSSGRGSVGDAHRDVAHRVAAE